MSSSLEDPQPLELQTLFECDTDDVKYFCDFSLNHIAIAKPTDTSVSVWATFIRNSSCCSVFGPVKLDCNPDALVDVCFSPDRSFLFYVYKSADQDLTAKLAFLSATIVRKDLLLTPKIATPLTDVSCYWLDLYSFLVVSPTQFSIFQTKSAKLDCKRIKTVKTPSTSHFFDLSSLLLLLYNKSSVQPFFFFPLYSPSKLLPISTSCEDPSLFTTVFHLHPDTYVCLNSDNQPKVFRLELSEPHTHLYSLSPPNSSFTFSRVLYLHDLLLAVDSSSSTIAFYDPYNKSPHLPLYSCPLTISELESFHRGNLIFHRNLPAVSSISLNTSVLTPFDQPLTSLHFLLKRTGTLPQIVDLLSFHLSYETSLLVTGALFDLIAKQIFSSNTPTAPTVSHFSSIHSFIGYIQMYQSLPTTSPIASFHSN
ncbi:hypothetical protein GEMRC1_007102 [Eukaryota sp. GEM-RC1]